MGINVNMINEGLTTKLSEAAIEAAIEKKDVKAFQTVTDEEELKNKSSDEIKEYIDKLEEKKEKVDQKIKLIQQEVETLKKELEKYFAEIVEQQEEMTQEQKEKSKEIFQKELESYIAECEKCAENGEEVPPKTKLGSAIESELAKIAPDFSSVLSKTVLANTTLNEIEAHLGTVSGLVLSSKALDLDISNASNAMSEAISREQAAASSSSSSDPIGFVADNIQYDFVIDKDGDNKLNATNEFLGAQNQWEEMKNLDTDNDNKVSTQELEQGNVSVVIDKGNDLKDISNTFGNNFYIDLASYKQGGNYEGIDQNLDTDNDGVKDQELLGTFEVNLADGKATGYNTLDDDDYLKENYNLEQDIPATETTQDDNWIEETEAYIEENKENIFETYESIGFTEAEITKMHEQTKDAGYTRASAVQTQFEHKLEETLAKKAEENKEAEENQEQEPEAQNNKLTIENGKIYQENEDGTKTEYNSQNGEEIEIDGKKYKINENGEAEEIK